MPVQTRSRGRVKARRAPPVPRRRKSTITPFTQFIQLPLELREYIWELALPGARLIEVYVRPLDELGGLRNGFEWKAVRCRCKKNCHELPGMYHTNREARSIAERRLPYDRCFGTFINWEIDTVLIGSRVGHLHNTGFLQAVEDAGGRAKLRHLAIDDDVWDESRYIHGHDHLAFKRCSPTGLVQQLSGLHTLTIVGRSGFWDDGTTPPEIDSDYEVESGREWIWGDSDIDTDEEFGTREDEYHDYNRMVKAEKRGRRKTKKSNSSSNNQHSREGSQSYRQALDLASSAALRRFLASPWFCFGPDLFMPRAYKPRATDGTERRVAGNGDCGLALVDFEELQALKGRILWMDEEESISIVKSSIQQDFENLKSDTTQFFDEVDIDEGEGSGEDTENYLFYPDYAVYKPPEIRLALQRKTAPSCFEADWKDLGKDYLAFPDDWI